MTRRWSRRCTGILQWDDGKRQIGLWWSTRWVCSSANVHCRYRGSSKQVWDSKRTFNDTFVRWHSSLSLSCRQSQIEPNVHGSTAILNVATSSEHYKGTAPREPVDCCGSGFMHTMPPKVGFTWVNLGSINETCTLSQPPQVLKSFDNPQES
jgi:hypothetical protein